MIEIQVTVHCPDIQAAAQIVATALEKQAPRPAATTDTVAIPTAPAPVAIPTAPPPAYTLAQVSKAGADLLTAKPESLEALQALLAQFDVPAVSALRPEQLGAFATALRGLGADI